MRTIFFFLLLPAMAVGQQVGIIASSRQSAIAFRAASGTDAATGTSVVLNKPSGTAEGDAMLAIINANENATTITPPAGWTSVLGELNPTSGASIEVFYKEAGASEGSTYTFSLSSSVRASGAIVAFSGAFNSNFVDVSGGSAAASSGLETDRAYGPSVSTTVASTMLVYLSAYDDAATTYTYSQASGFTEAVQTSGAAKCVIGYKALTSSGSTGQIEATVSTSGSPVFCGNFSVAIKQN